MERFVRGFSKTNRGQEAAVVLEAPAPKAPTAKGRKERRLIDETKRQTDRDLTRFDLDFDLPDHFLPEFPAPIYLTTRPDLGDVSSGMLLGSRLRGNDMFWWNEACYSLASGFRIRVWRCGLSTGR